MLPRPRLIGALQAHVERPVSLVVSDAGYGKTTLLSGFVETQRRPVVWYSLMPSDADLVVFGRHLVAGFRAHAPRFGKTFERTLTAHGSAPPPPDWLGGLFVAELEKLSGPPLLLVLDDFHEVNGAAPVLRMLDAVLRALPARVRLLIGSRVPPALALERLRVRGDVFELDSTHLRFTRDELLQLFAEVYRRPLIEGELDAVEAATGGWPTAVHLVHETRVRAPDLTLADVLDDFRGSNHDLRDFLSSEILARLASDERRVLERAAALQRFDAGLAAALTGLPDVAPVLQRLARRGLVRRFGTGPAAGWEFHEIVRQFLRGHIERTGGVAAWTALEADTGALLASRGEPERALRHLLDGGRPAEARALLATLAPRLLREGRAATLQSFLTDLPPELIAGDPELQLALAEARQATGDWDEAARTFTAVLARCEDEGLRVPACRALLGLTKVLNLRARHEEVLGMAQRGLAMLGADGDPDVRLRLLQRMAGAHFYLGQSGEAVRILSEVRAGLPQASDRDLALPVAHNLAMAYAAMGRLREASRELEAVLGVVRDAPSPKTPLYLSNLAFLLADLGDLPEARAAAEEGLAAARRFGNRAQEITCRQALAQVMAELGDLDGALAMLKEAEAVNRTQRMERVTGELLALNARIFCARGQYRRAIEFLERAIERLDPSDRPRQLEYRVRVAWCELRAGRPHVARELLEGLVARADAGENEHERMRVHWWLGEARLALGDRAGAKRSLAAALEHVRERGYGHFLATQAREEPAPLLFALEHGLAPEVAAAALTQAGVGVEGALLDALEAARPGRHEAIATVLAEIGGHRALERLPKIAARRPALRPAVRVALRAIQSRVERVTPDAAAVGGGREVRLVLHGPPRLEVDGRPVPASAWRTQRAFHILVYLALHPRGASRDRLLEAFWPGRQLAAGRRNFHPTLSYIRALLPRGGSGPLLREGEHYRLDPAYPFTCDAWEFDREFAAAREAATPPERRARLESACALATLPLLDGVDGAWAGDAQARSRDTLEQAFLACGEACMHDGDHAAALPWLKRAAELDAFRETTRVAVIECLVRTGQRRAALVERERMVQLLRDELGVEPLSETRARLRSLLGAETGAETLEEIEVHEPS